jgi:hypothetical protein
MASVPSFFNPSLYEAGEWAIKDPELAPKKLFKRLSKDLKKIGRGTKVKMKKGDGTIPRGWDYGVYMVVTITTPEGEDINAAITLNVAEGAEASGNVHMDAPHGVVSTARDSTADRVIGRMMSDVVSHLKTRVENVEGVTGPTRMEIQKYIDKELKLGGSERQAIMKAQKAFGMSKIRLNSKGVVVAFEECVTGLGLDMSEFREAAGLAPKTFGGLLVEQGTTADRRPAMIEAGSVKQRLMDVGPPTEWSGAVAAALGKEERAELKAAWEAMSKTEQDEVQAAFDASWDDVEPIQLGERVGTPDAITQAIEKMHAAWLKHLDDVAGHGVAAAEWLTTMNDYDSLEYKELLKFDRYLNGLVKKFRQFELQTRKWRAAVNLHLEGKKIDFKRLKADLAQNLKFMEDLKVKLAEANKKAKAAGGEIDDWATKKFDKAVGPLAKAMQDTIKAL